ncbi:hypothetical protein ACJRO7_002068 [Eucalyptus globulus]|uniref:Uncharacterized protein n=1 Tax=Eucalyptus globulus TaxID=34317 RepID=A0ABD3M304_EUCGL
MRMQTTNVDTTYDDTNNKRMTMMTVMQTVHHVRMDDDAEFENYPADATDDEANYPANNSMYGMDDDDANYSADHVSMRMRMKMRPARCCRINKQHRPVMQLNCSQIFTSYKSMKYLIS